MIESFDADVEDNSFERKKYEVKFSVECGPKGLFNIVKKAA